MGSRVGLWDEDRNYSCFHPPPPEAARTGTRDRLSRLSAQLGRQVPQPRL